MSGWTPEAVAEAYRRAGQAPPADLGEIKPVSKYHSRKKEIDGIVFDSCAEARRYQDLKMMQDAGFISDLELQPVFLLQSGFRDQNAKWHRPITYAGDFKYLRIRGEHQTDQWVVEDVKGVQTLPFRMKWKMAIAKYPYISWEIWDTRKKRALRERDGEKRKRCVACGPAIRRSRCP